MAAKTDKLTTEIRALPIGQLKHLEVNARYMTADQQKRLTDEAFQNLNDLSLGGFTVAPPEYQDITITFLPDDAQEFHELLKRIEKTKAITHVAHLDDFNGLFDAIVAVKENNDVINSAIAVHLVVKLALERLEQITGDGEVVE